MVIELKAAARFRQEHAGQLGFYVAAVDDQLRNPAVHAFHGGILLCASRTENRVKYALRSSNAPMAIATYTYDTLPAPERVALPPVEAVNHAFAASTADAIDAIDEPIDREGT